MTDLGILRWIRELDENGAVALARALVFAEAGRHHLPLNEFTISGRVKARDQGIDGRTHFPDRPGMVMPTGRLIWQVKSGSSPPSATDEFDEEKHAALFRAIRDGYDYVLFWANDPVDPTMTTVTSNFTEAVRAVRADANATFLFADAIERLCHSHMGVLGQQSPIPVSGVVRLSVWAPEDFGSVRFQADAARADFVDVIRQHASIEELPAELHVIGDTGVGKSRLVFEALTIEGIAERVLVIPDASRWDAGLLAFVAQSPERSLIAVVDDCDAADRRSLSRYSGMARGRIRLITIGSRSTRERSSADLRYMELMPLEAAAAREIARSVGLEEGDADRVAELTEGYPGLALTLAKAIRYGLPGGSLIERVRGHEEIGSVLSTLLPEPDVIPLGMLSLFERIGFDGDLSQELALACELLEVDEVQVRRLADRELGRFVSTAGRFRRVTPRLFAIWLASQFIRDRQDSLRRALSDLPESLRDRIITQMQEFAGDPVVASTLCDILGEPPFRSGALGDVSEGAARLLHVAALAAPDAAMDAIDRVLDGLSPRSLHSYGPGRHELVWALEVLVWFEPLFDRAADALLRLAVAENETRLNNATRLVEGLFRVFLGGTAAPYSARLNWALTALQKYGRTVHPILIEALGHALEPSEVRSSTHFGGLTAPTEWRPTLVEDEIAARSGAWALLIELARSDETSSDLVARAIARGLPTALRRGLAPNVLTDLRTVAWPARARGALGDALAKAVRYDDPPAALAMSLRELETEIRGRSLWERLDYALSLSPWQLAEDKQEAVSGRPRLLQELAAELAESDRAVVADAAARSRHGDPQTARNLFEELARTAGDEGLLTDLEHADPAVDAALLGTLRGLEGVRGEGWADQTLERWLTSPFARLVVPAAHLLPPSDQRALLAVRAVDQRDCSSSELGRFLYGAWAQSLDPSVLREVLARLQDCRSAHDVESGLGILEQWLEFHSPTEVVPELRDVAAALLNQATRLSDSSSPMLRLYRSRVINSIGLPFDDRLSLLVALLGRVDSFLESSDLDVLDALAREKPQATVNAVLGFLLGDNVETFRPAVMWLGEAKLLSRLIDLTSADLVTSAVLQSAPPDSWPELVAHIRFTTEDPDPLLITLLERSDSEILHGRATFRFMYPETVWTGPESDHLARAREKAERWKALQALPGGFREWLKVLVTAIDERIASALREESERGY